MVNALVAWDFDGLTVIENGYPGHRGWLYGVTTTVSSVRGVSISSLGGVEVGDPINNPAFPYAPTIGYGGTASVNNWQSGGYSAANAMVTYLAETTTSPIATIYAPAGE